MTQDNWLMIDVARGRVYEGLARCFCKPDRQLAENLKGLEHHLAQLQSESVPYIIQMQSECADSEALDQLLIEFARLFIGPFSLPAPPYGSVYLEDRHKLMGDSTMAVRQCYRQAGLEMAADFKDAPDHIAAELEFICYLIFGQIRERQTECLEAAEKFLDMQHLFLQQHLGTWTVPFTDELAGQAQSGFYQHLAHAVRIFIAEDMRLIGRS